MSEETIKNKIRLAPKKPGVYQFFDDGNNLLYVGKAKNLKNRVASYFSSEKTKSGKLKLMVNKINSIKFILTENEKEALLLENNLIKRHQPKYNVLLKDDKSYPWICIKNEPVPRVFGTRNLKQDGSEYFGPYTSARMMNDFLDLIRKNYKLRSCSYLLSEENISSGKYKVCLEYHLGNCKGPCEGKQSSEDYAQNIEEIRNIVKGNVGKVKKRLKIAMMEAAQQLRFEEAAEYKRKIETLSLFQQKSTVVNPSIKNLDVFSLIEEEDLSYVNYMKVHNGAVIQGHTLEIKKRLEESKHEILSIAIAEMKSRFKSESGTMVVPFKPDFEMEGVKFIVPKRGDKKSLLDLSMRNGKFYQFERRKQRQKTDPERHSNRILKTLKDDLRLNVLPIHIECFDNSNIQGSNPVAACVVFKNAKPAKKEYRHFNIKTVVGPDDFASMEEVVLRRYKRLLEEDNPLPQLIVIDGGKGQLNAALKSLEILGLRGKIAVIGIAKRLEEIYFPGDSLALHLDKKSESLKVIQQLRNEAHRFGITHHRNRRSKAAIQSQLTEIKGIGKESTQLLLQKFKSVKRIQHAGKSELAAVVGLKKAQLLWEHFNADRAER
ncbi:MAG: excinuclease ABC subunit C [Verrucomicrobia bacterium]|nr:excinuclease ABC subunit C [Verrucomicrobiota bacterium]